MRSVKNVAWCSAGEKWKLLSGGQLFATPWTVHSPWNSPAQNTGMGSLSLLQGIFPTQGSNPGLPHCRRILYQLSHKGSPYIYMGYIYRHKYIYIYIHIYICISEVIDISPSNLDSSLCFFQHSVSHDVLISRVTIYSLDVLLFLFGTSLLFHIQF